MKWKSFFPHRKQPQNQVKEVSCEKEPEKKITEPSQVEKPGNQRFKKTVARVSTPGQIRQYSLRAVASQISLIDRFCKRLSNGSSTNLREAFQKMDQKKFGHISMEQFQSALAITGNFNDFNSHETALLFHLADTAGNNDGMVDYIEFFEMFGRKIVEELVETDSDDLLQVIIITRHGARFPLKPFPESSSWPRHTTFWKKFSGCLTPTGHLQHNNLGSRLAKRYVGVDKLLDPNYPELAAWVHAYTSASDRTLGSAQSLLLGMFPSCAQSFRVENETFNSHHKSVEGIAIHIANMENENEIVLHGFKGSQTYDALKKKAFDENKSLDDYAEDLEIQNLLQRLWEMTGFEKLNPSKPFRSRITHLQSIAQAIDIERAHQMEIFSNKKGYRLISKDEESIREIAHTICHLRYQGLNDDMQLEMSRIASGMLPKIIADHIQEMLENQENIKYERQKLLRQQNDDAFLESFRHTIDKSRNAKKFVFFSAHDNTIMALLSHLGVRDWPIPSFASFFLIELHRSNSSGLPFIKVAYNPTPCTESLDSDPVEPHFFSKLPVGQEIISFNEAMGGKDEPSLELPAGDFINFLMNTKKSLVSHEEWASVSGNISQKKEEEEETNSEALMEGLDFEANKGEEQSLEFSNSEKQYV